jgi:acyl carrier protein
MSDIERRVKELIAEQLGVSDELVVGHANFANDLGADSLDIVELVLALEDEFGLEIKDDEVAGITTVQQVVERVASYAKV